MTSQTRILFKDLEVGISFHFGDCALEKIDRQLAKVLRDGCGDVPPEPTFRRVHQDALVVSLQRRRTDHPSDH